MSKKYIVYPCYVKSKNDEQMHFVTAETIIKSYGVNPTDCIIWDYQSPIANEGLKLEEYIHLYPKFNGDYILKGGK